MHVPSLFCITTTLLLLCAFASAQHQPVNQRPIIGILSQPVETDASQQYIPASYVKWIEGAGARTVPIFFNTSQEDLDYLFSSINGLVYPGGEQNLEHGLEFYDAAKYLYNLAVAANKRGDYFPVWGTCQGFQFLHVAASGADNESCMDNYDAWNISWPLDFTPDAKTSRLFADAPKDVIVTLATKNVTMNWHHQGISPSVYKTFPLISSTYNMIATNKDRNNKEFVSVMEGKELPFYGVQFHPEYSIFAWSAAAAASHTRETVVAMQYLSDFFVEEARKNTHKFPSTDKENNALFYNYNPGFSQTYLWPSA